jgi:hypothetical protein
MFSAVACWGAPPPYSLKQRVENSEVIVVASFAGSDPAPRTLRISSPNEAIPGIAVYPCAITIKIDRVIKGALGQLGDKPIVVSYLRSRDCALEIVGTPVRSGQDLIWFLRKEGDLVRTFVDNYAATIPLKPVSPQTRQELAHLANPELAIAYLLLNNDIRGVGISEVGRTASSAAELADLTGWSNFWRISSDLYRRGSSAEKETVCLLTSHFGACVNCARGVMARNPGLISERDPSYALLKSAAFNDFEQQKVEEMRPDSLLAFQKAFPKIASKQIEEDLYWNACVSSREVRIRARDLLLRLFGQGPETVHCIPCENLQR